MIRVRLLLVLLSGAVGCALGSDDDIVQDDSKGRHAVADSLLIEICGAVVDPSSRPTGAVTVGDLEAPCTIEFREVARLAGSLDSIAPRWPLAMGPGGSYVSATYRFGRLAVWSSTGTLLRVFGNGEGQGPGEFANMNGLLVGTDSVVNVFTGRAEWHRYHWSGEYLETVRAPTMSGLTEPVVLADGTIVTAAMRPEGPVLVAWREDRTAELVETKVEPGYHQLLLGASRGAGLWSAEMPSYVLRRHQMPAGDVAFEIRREAPWFRTEHGRTPYVTQLTVDERGLVWISTDVPDSSPPAGPPVATSSDEARRRQTIQYRDAVMEVFTFDGRLLASRRFDDLLRMTGRGLAGDIWVLQEDDLLESLVIRRAVLVPN